MTLADGTGEWPLTSCEVTADRITVELPEGMRGGTYQLTVATQAGSCNATLPVLQGERGEPGAIGPEGPAGPLPVVSVGGGLTGTGSAASPLAVDFDDVARSLASVGCGVGDVINGFDASGAPICVALNTAPALVERLARASVRGGGSVPYAWEFVPGFVLPFHAAGGPVQVISSIPLTGGSHSTCRALIDGFPASLFTGADTSYFWAEGLIITNDGWGMWNSPRVYPNVPAGPHVLSMQCRTDVTTANTSLGNGSMTNTVAVVPYGPAASSEVKAYSVTVRGGQTIGASSFSTVTGLSLQFQAQGGPVTRYFTLSGSATLSLNR